MPSFDAVEPAVDAIQSLIELFQTSRMIGQVAANIRQTDLQ
jgi:hypothetical protein